MVAPDSDFDQRLFIAAVEICSAWQARMKRPKCRKMVNIARV